MWDCCFFAPIIKKYHLSTFCQDTVRNWDLHTCDNTHSQVYYNTAGSQNTLTLWCTSCFVSSSAEIPFVIHLSLCLTQPAVSLAQSDLAKLVK